MGNTCHVFISSPYELAIVYFTLFTSCRNNVFVIKFQNQHPREGDGCKCLDRLGAYWLQCHWLTFKCTVVIKQGTSVFKMSTVYVLEVESDYLAVTILLRYYRHRSKNIWLRRICWLEHSVMFLFNMRLSSLFW